MLLLQSHHKLRELRLQCLTASYVLEIMETAWREVGGSQFLSFSLVLRVLACIPQVLGKTAVFLLPDTSLIFSALLFSEVLTAIYSARVYLPTFREGLLQTFQDSTGHGPVQICMA